MAQPTLKQSVADLSDELKQAAQLEGIFKAVGALAPELGEELSVAFSGPLGPLLALGMALKNFQQIASGAISEYNDELDKEGAELYQPHLDALKAIQDAWDDAAQHMAEYQTRLAHAGEDTDPIGTDFQQRKELAHAKLNANRKIAESEGQAAEAKVRDEDTQKGMSPQAIEQDVAKVRMATSKKLDALTDQGNADDISRLEQESKKRTQAEVPDDVATKAARRTAQAAQATFESDEAHRKSLLDAGWDRPLNEEELAKLRKEHPLDERVALADAQDNLELAKNAPSVTYQGGIMAGMGQPIQNDNAPGIAAAQAQVDAAEKAVKAEQDTLKGLNDTLADREQKVTAAAADADRDEQITKTDEAGRKQLPAKIAMAQLVEQERLRGEQVSESNLATTAQINAKIATGTAPPGVPGGKDVTDTQAATITALYQLLDKSQKNSEAILNLITVGLQKHESTEQIIKELQGQMANQSFNYR